MSFNPANSSLGQGVDYSPEAIVSVGEYNAVASRLTQDQRPLSGAKTRSLIYEWCLPLPGPWPREGSLAVGRPLLWAAPVRVWRFLGMVATVIGKPKSQFSL